MRSEAKGWVRFERGFQGGPAITLLRLSGVRRGDAWRLVPAFLERVWCTDDLDRREREDAELIASLFVESLPAGVTARRRKRGWSTALEERVLVRLYDGNAEVRAVKENPGQDRRRRSPTGQEAPGATISDRDDR